MNVNYESLINEIDKLILIAEENKNSMEKKKKSLDKIKLKILLAVFIGYFSLFCGLFLIVKSFEFQNEFYKMGVLFFVFGFIIIISVIIISLFNSLKEIKKELKIDDSMQRRLFSIIDEENSRIEIFNSINDKIPLSELLIIQSRLMRLGMKI